MSTIHVETDALRDTVSVCEYALVDIDDSYADIRAAALRLETGWQGGSAGTFHAELRDWLRATAEAIDRLDSLWRALARQADGWEEIDQRWTAAYRERRPRHREEVART
jgi:WXG100 family type VII secretion target